MISCNTVMTSNYTLLFKEFATVDNLFRKHGWKCFINETERVAYTRKSFETEFFEVKKNKDEYLVSFPLTNSIYQYKTTCSDAIYTQNYILDKFMEYILYNN
jgi:hypothetical protein